MKKVAEEAKEDKKLAAVIIGQAIVDEGYIGTDTITIRYNSEVNARALWELANKWNWANKLQKHIYIDNRRPLEKKIAWRFNLKRSRIKEIYDIIGDLYDSRKNEKIQNLLKIGKLGITKGIKQGEVFEEISKSPKTVENLAIIFNVTGGSIRRHLSKLTEEGKISRKRLNSYGKHIYFKNTP